MIIRPYHPKDLHAIADLFYRAVHAVPASDYTEEQLEAWADGQPDLAAWNRSFLEHCTLTVWKEDILVGFADLDCSGYLDRLFVDPRFQRKDIASALCDALEQNCSVPVISVHASITALPFFEKRGFRIVCEEQVQRKGILLRRYYMKKAG